MPLWCFIVFLHFISLEMLYFKKPLQNAGERVLIQFQELILKTEWEKVYYTLDGTPVHC